MVVLARESVPAALLALEPHGLIFPRGSGAARLIGAAMREVLCAGRRPDGERSRGRDRGHRGADDRLRARKLAGDEADRVKSRRKAALDYIDAHLGNAQLGPDEIADAAHLSRASLYRLLAAEGGIRAVLSKRRLDEALRLMLADNKDERSLKEIAKCCGFGGTSQFSRAFRARFGVPPRSTARSCAGRTSIGTKRGSGRWLRPGRLFLAATAVERIEEIPRLVMSEKARQIGRRLIAPSMSD